MQDAELDGSYFANAVTQLKGERALHTAKPVYGPQGIKILDQGTKVNPKLYERLLQHQPIAPLEDAMEIESAVNGKSLRAAAEEILGHMPLFARMAATPADRNLLLDCLEAVPLPTAVAFQLTVVQSVRPEQFRYFVATALTAIWLGNHPLAVRHDLVMLAAAGLLHDLGMMHIDPVLLQPHAEITPDQRRQLYSHPLVSVLLLERHHDYTADMLRAIREHHESLDGAGYPGGLAGNAISPWGRTMALAQVVASIAKPGHSHALLRLLVLLRTNRQRYDGKLVDRLVALIQPLTGASDDPQPIDKLLDDPLMHLGKIQQALLGWPADLADSPHWSPLQRDGLAFIGGRCAQMLRTLNESGVSSEQLTSLGDDEITGALANELSLITHELAWQLRALEREARRRWSTSKTADETLPDALLHWTTQMEEAWAGLLRSPSADTAAVV
jgi:hypothetical protein